MSHKRNIKLLLAFDGAGYAGWQKQKSAKAVQGVIEDKLHIMTGEALSLNGAGRTDAGVHAFGMVANFNTEANIPCLGFVKGLNSMLPSDIRVLEAYDVEPDFHARRSAKAKTYWYNFSNGPVQLPTERLYSAHVFEELSGRGAVRTILEASLETLETVGKHRFVITGDGFLRHMVRNIVGTILEVGKGKLAQSDVAAILAAKDRCAAGPTAPAAGLFLKEVFYE